MFCWSRSCESGEQKRVSDQDRSKIYGHFRHQAHLGRHTLSFIICHETALFRRSCLYVLRSHQHCKWRRLRPATSRALLHERCSRWIEIAYLRFGWAQYSNGCCLQYLMPKLEWIQILTPTQARTQARAHFDAVYPIVSPMTYRLVPTPTRRRTLSWLAL